MKKSNRVSSVASDLWKMDVEDHSFDELNIDSIFGDLGDLEAEDLGDMDDIDFLFNDDDDDLSSDATVDSVASETLLDKTTPSSATT